MVLAGGYEDGEDYEEVIFYTGHGGRDPQTREQIRHQVLTRGNLALAQNRLHGLPVRVIRGAGFRSPYAPDSGYRYDGLYTVNDYWRGVGRAGFFIWRFRLVKMDKDLQRQERVVQERLHTQELKRLYHYHCQMCRVQLRGTPGHMPKRCISDPSKPRTTALIPPRICCVCVRTAISC